MIRENRYLGTKMVVKLDNRYKYSDGSYKVIIRVSNSSKYYNVNTGVTAKNLDDLDDTATEIIDGIMKKVLKAVKEVSRSGFTINGFKELYNVPKSTIGDLIREQIKKLNEEERFGCANIHIALLKKLDENFGEIPFKSMTAEVPIKLSAVLTKEGYSPTTIRIYLSTLKTICHYASYKKYLDENCFPFKTHIYDIDKVEIPKGNKRTDHYLTKKEIQKLYDWTLKTKDKLVAVFMFSYLAGGMNFADIKNLSFDRHYEFSECQELAYKRVKVLKKTDLLIRIPLNKWIQPLLDILNPNRSGNLIGYVNADDPKRAYNDKLMMNNRISRATNAACKSLGIKKDVSLTYARHSFATIMSREPVPASYIEYSMGHANNGVSSHYIAGYTSEELMKFSEFAL